MLAWRLIALRAGEYRTVDGCSPDASSRFAPVNTAPWMDARLTPTSLAALFQARHGRGESGRDTPHGPPSAEGEGRTFLVERDAEQESRTGVAAPRDGCLPMAANVNACASSAAHAAACVQGAPADPVRPSPR